MLLYEDACQLDLLGWVVVHQTQKNHVRVLEHVTKQFRGIRLFALKVLAIEQVLVEVTYTLVKDSLADVHTVFETKHFINDALLWWLLRLLLNDWRNRGLLHLDWLLGWLLDLLLDQLLDWLLDLLLRNLNLSQDRWLSQWLDLRWWYLNCIYNGWFDTQRGLKGWLDICCCRNWLSFGSFSFSFHVCLSISKELILPNPELLISNIVHLHLSEHLMGPKWLHVVSVYHLYFHNTMYRIIARIAFSSRQSRIQQLLTEQLKPSTLQIINESNQHSGPRNGETHFKVTVVSELFTTMDRLARQRFVNEILKEEFKSGLHALSINAKTENEWKTSNEVAPSPRCLGGSKSKT